MFRLPEELKEKLKEYKSSLEELGSGKMSSARFKGIRVPWGIYSHRGGRVFMTRIRVPAGYILASQLKALADVSQKYGDSVLHITTRQDIQLHEVKIEDTIKVMEYLQGYDLSPRGGGGNTVRNVTSCALAGVCSEEVFDVREASVPLTEYLLRQDDSFNLPRKFKVSFSGCPKDCAGCVVNDVGLIAVCNNGAKGFRVFAGGGMGADSSVGKLLEEFIVHNELAYCVSAIKRVFYKEGDRRNKHHNRLRFLIEDIGFEKFKKLYKQELDELKKNEYISLRKIELEKKDASDGAIPEAADSRYNEFLRYSVRPQKESGYSIVELRIPRGDISAERLKKIADLANAYPGIEFRTSQSQNLFFVWVKNKDLYDLFLKLKSVAEDFLYPETLLDVVACKGALTCNLGLCNSPGLAKEIESVIKEGFVDKKVFDRLEIKLNGCPNACGQQPIGKLSFCGLVRRVDNRPVPFYKFFMGGRKESELTKFGKEIGIIPAKNIPAFLREFLTKAEGEIARFKDVYEFIDHAGMGIAGKILERYSYVPSYSEDKDFYRDWGKQEDFSLEGLGPGECGAGVVDMIEADLTEARVALEKAKSLAWAAGDIKMALFLAARALLIVKGRDPKEEKEAFSGFKKEFIDAGIASRDYADTEKIYETTGEKLTSGQRESRFAYAEKFLAHVDAIYKRMDSSFNFPKEEKGPEKKSDTEEGLHHILDLKGTPCPINYVKTKLFLENLKPGETVEVLLDEGEPIENVPRSLENDGHQIVKIDKKSGFYRVIVKKRGDNI